MGKKTHFSFKSNIKSTVLASLFAAVIIVCALVTVPAPIPFTLQTLGVFCALAVLGGKHGTLSVIIYIFTGIIGLPVFSGFTGGVGHILGPTGGYIIGFIFTSLFYWLITRSFGEKTIIKALALTGGTVIYYLFGSVWYCAVYLKDFSPAGFLTSVSLCVIPFIIPDILKLCLALFIDYKLPKNIK